MLPGSIAWIFVERFGFDAIFVAIGFGGVVVVVVVGVVVFVVVVGAVACGLPVVFGAAVVFGPVVFTLVTACGFPCGAFGAPDFESGAAAAGSAAIDSVTSAMEKLRTCMIGILRQS